MLYNILMIDYNDGLHEPETSIYATIECSEDKIESVVEQIYTAYNPKYSGNTSIRYEKVKVLNDITDKLPKYVCCTCTIYHKKYRRIGSSCSLYSYPTHSYHKTKIRMYNEKENEESRWGDITITFDRETYDKTNKEELKKMFEALVPEGYTL